MSFRILYQDQSLVAIEKPAGFHVHPPEDPSFRISSSFNCLSILRKQLGIYLHPVHRLDRATSGVLVFALNRIAARVLCSQFEQNKVKKNYFAVTRGWTPQSGEITLPLKSDSNRDQFLNSLTSFSRIASIELPYPTGPYQTSRYSLIRVQPKTGRRHQIRRHFNHISHPLVGDTIYGDTDHNRFFKQTLQMSGLFLKAHSVEFPHPETNLPLKIRSRWNGSWHRVFDLFNICPLDSDNLSFELDKKSH